MTRFRIALAIAALGMTAAGPLPAEPATAFEASAFERLTAWRFEPDRHAVALTVGAPVTVSTRSLGDPPRLVVDIPKLVLSRPKVAFVPRDPIVAGVRMSQFRVLPPVVRVVIDLHPGPEPAMAVQQQDGVLYLTFARLTPDAAPASSLPAPAVPPPPLPAAAPSPTPRKPAPSPVPPRASVPLPPRALPAASPKPAAASPKPPAASGEAERETFPAWPDGDR